MVGVPCAIRMEKTAQSLIGKADQLQSAGAAGGGSGLFGMSFLNIVISVVAGIVGMWYFSKGKKEGRLPYLISAAVLCVFPYFISTEWILVGICLFFVFVPPFLKNKYDW